MKPDQERVKTLLSQTVTLLCKNGLHFEKELRIQGLLGITIDCDSVFIVHFNESLTDFVVENACGVENNNGTSLSNGKISSALPLEGDFEKTSRREAVKAPSVEGTGCVSLSRFETPLGPEDDVKEVKAEPTSETEGDDVVLVDSENEQNSGRPSENTLFQPNSSRKSETRVRRDRKHVSHPQQLPHSHKRQRLALPVSVENTSVYDDGANYSVKLEPLSSQYLDNDGQNVGYDEAFTGQHWDNSKSVFRQVENDATEELPGCSSWEGFDLQSRGLTSANTMTRGNELYHESGTSAASLPLNSLDNLQIRNALVDQIIRPLVFQAGRRVEAFRIIWRKNCPTALTTAWNHIHRLRQDCDETMKTVCQSGCLFFFSSVTGLYNKSKSRTLGAHGDIYPAVSYYVVLFSECPLNFVDFATPLKAQYANTEIKQILSHIECFGVDLRHLSAPLFTALKDCSSSYVRDKLERSALALEAALLSGASPSHVTAVAKLFVMDQSLVSAVGHAHACIMKVAPYLGLQVVF